MIKILALIFFLVELLNCYNSTDFDVAIIGAGPGGLSAALALSKLGISVGVFEKAKEFRPIGAALGMNIDGYESLKAIGGEKLASRVRRLSANIDDQLLMRPNGEVLYSGESPLKGTPFTWLAWYTIQTCLKESLSLSVKIFMNCKLQSFQEFPDEGFVHLNFSSTPLNIRTRLLIGADGYNSVVRAATVGDGSPLYTGTMTWRGIIKKSSFKNKDIINSFPFQNNCGFQTIVGNRKNFWFMDCGPDLLAWTATALQDDNAKSDNAQQTVLKTFDEFPEVAKTLMQATDPSAIVETGVYDRFPVQRWGNSGRVTLLGDAAHPIRPSLGMGTTNALLDVVSLVKHLSRNFNFLDNAQMASAISAYESERIAATTPLFYKAREGGTNSHSERHADDLKAALDKARDARGK